MRQSAWLTTAPQNKDEKDKREPVSRLEQMKAKGETPLWPPNPAPYLTDWLMEIGPAVPGMAGLVGLGWRDLAAWQEITGIELEPWEARLLKGLSEIWASEQYHARSHDRPPPFSGLEDEETAETVRDTVARQVRAMFSGGRAKGKRN